MNDTLLNDAVDPVILYVLMRTDLPDYQPGKTMAQANHAGTRFVSYVGQAIQDAPEDAELHTTFQEWMQEADSFGTVIVLGCSYSQMEQRLDTAHHLGLVMGRIHDPTYPIRDGHIMQTLPVDTCGYVFGRKSECRNAVFELSLFSG